MRFISRNYCSITVMRENPHEKSMTILISTHHVVPETWTSYMHNEACEYPDVVTINY